MLLEEFDNRSGAIIEPGMIVTPLEDFPEVTVACFSVDQFEAIINILDDVQEICFARSAGVHIPMYAATYGGERIAFFRMPVGEPAAVGIYEDFMAFGSKRLILAGICGVLDRSIADLGIIIPNAAIRDEGCSYHYAPPSDELAVNHDEKYVRLFKEVCAEAGYNWVEGKTWTTDAMYRETRDKMERRKQQGAICVEMECAGLQAACDYRGTEFFQFLYAGDNLDHSQWQPRSLGSQERLDDKARIVLLAFELAVKISKEGEANE